MLRFRSNIKSHMVRKVSSKMIFIGVLCFITIVKGAETERKYTQPTNTTVSSENDPMLRSFLMATEDSDDKDNMKEGSRSKLRHRLVSNISDDCLHVCDDLPDDDTQPVCMMISRYKKGYQYFVNHCHARRTICKDNLMLHMVHPNRCLRTNTFFMPAS